MKKMFLFLLVPLLLLSGCTVSTGAVYQDVTVDAEGLLRIETVEALPFSDQFISDTQIEDEQEADASKWAFATWQELEEYIGFPIANPLEKINWLTEKKLEPADLYRENDRKLLLYPGNQKKENAEAVAYAFYLKDEATVTQCVFLGQACGNGVPVHGEAEAYQNAHGLKGLLYTDDSRDNKYCGCYFGMNGMLYHVYVYSPVSSEDARDTLLEVMKYY